MYRYAYIVLYDASHDLHDEREAIDHIVYIWMMTSYEQKEYEIATLSNNYQALK